MLDFHDAGENQLQTEMVKMPELQENLHFQISTAIFIVTPANPTGGNDGRWVQLQTSRRP
jgi:hypothetical protein